MKLVEMIEALQSQAIEQIHVATTNSETGKQALIDALRARFAPLLAAARAQGKELADLHVASDMVAMELAAKQEELAALKEENSDLSLQVKHYHDARMPEQHSANLRAVAEMAIAMCFNYKTQIGPWPTADSILRSFREKQQKAEVKAHDSER